MADRQGLYFIRFDEPAQRLEIALYDGPNLQGMIFDVLARDIYDHFLTIADHGTRDAFVYGVLMVLRAAGGVEGIGFQDKPADKLATASEAPDRGDFL